MKTREAGRIASEDGAPLRIIQLRASQDPFASRLRPVMMGLLSAENQLGGAARNHVRGRRCPRSSNDPWHHGGIRHP
jgi:hypothetical protein